MILLQPHETELIGEWIVTGGRVQRDVVTERIEALLSGVLEKIAVSTEGWNTLLRDPADGRLWELWYPHGEMHGGGPPALRCIALRNLST